MSNIEFESPAARIIKQFDKSDEQFRIPTDLPDLALLRRLSVQGRLRYVRGGGTATVTLTPNQGETFFIYRIICTNADAAVSTYTITNDGQERAIFVVPSVGLSIPYDLNMLDSLVGNGTKTFTVTNNRVNASATIFFWVENTSRIRDVTI